MVSVRWSVIVASVVAAISTPSHACRVFLMPKKRLDSGYESAISAVALVRVTEAQYTHAPIADAHPWRATATVLQVFQGSYPAKTMQFQRGWGSAACDDRSPIAKAGSLWVVYFWKRAEGDQPVWQSYPADVAFKADPRLTQTVQERP